MPATEQSALSWRSGRPALLVSLFQGAIAQAPSAPPPPPATASATPLAFFIADVHALPHSKATYPIFNVHNDRFVLHHATIVDMINLAYDMDRNKVLGGPSWLDNNRYEIAALAPPDTKFPAKRLMLPACSPTASSWSFILKTNRSPRTC